MTAKVAARTGVFLFESPLSSASWRIRAALVYKSIPFESIIINTAKNEHKLPQYTAMNPSGLVPTLQIDGIFLNQTPSIFEYLEETRPTSPLLPPATDPVARARVRALSSIIMCDTHPIQNLSVLVKISNLRGREGRDKEMAKWAIEKGFTAYEKMLASTMGTYSYGDSLTVADICLAAQHYNGVAKYDVDMAPFPLISKVMETVYQHDCISKTHPKNNA
ncbi:glutathione S-transferase [Chytriomyces cf. hyalinus JEL632]|nr:glutathione S-transferase [Chytriomyces cf. hyalinus JEL632]